ncbi:unnamed protein product [Didymodactylos carnosus]|uniref:Uncharacterized protein n=1 Tax=Didymodactylos carnosus TaxID=1234261 RepID=A0A815PSR8_9BILA|nr:unnamed protein product [Didymodactylos carnosus]CAF1453014.1 unnamed protein product [Didymodactylos carnosus]CAF4069117.1 unnamed protein product [Didymodactylos carnosus]CAF4325764.1 unnamed protein product [Didymodactylos carnosus]
MTLEHPDIDLKELIITSVRDDVQLQNDLRDLLDKNSNDFNLCLEHLATHLVEPIQQYIDKRVLPIEKKINDFERYSRSYNLRFDRINNSVPVYLLKNTIVQAAQKSGIQSVDINLIEVAYHVGKLKKASYSYSKILFTGSCSYITSQS